MTLLAELKAILAYEQEHPEEKSGPNTYIELHTTDYYEYPNKRALLIANFAEKLISGEIALDLSALETVVAPSTEYVQPSYRRIAVPYDTVPEISQKQLDHVTQGYIDRTRDTLKSFMYGIPATDSLNGRSIDHMTDAVHGAAYTAPSILTLPDYIQNISDPLRSRIFLFIKPETIV